jgi:hypothetical protein
MDEFVFCFVYDVCAQPVAIRRHDQHKLFKKKNIKKDSQTDFFYFNVTHIVQRLFSWSKTTMGVPARLHDLVIHGPT